MKVKRNIWPGVFAAVLLTAAAIACGSDSGSAAVRTESTLAPRFEFVGVAPGNAGAVEISNDSREGLVTVLYFSFVG